MLDLINLKEALQLGLSVVSVVWNYQTKDWVTSVHATDINNDGEIEIVIGSRDGRVHALTNEGQLLWERVVGSKRWIKAVVGIIPRQNQQHPVSVLVGTQDGKIYALDEIGQTISRDHRTVYHLEKSAGSADNEKDKQMDWHSSEYEIRQLAADLKKSSQVVIDSEDRCVRTFDYITGKSGWIFPTDSTIRAIFCCDINGDGHVATLVGTSDQHLYLLDATGRCVWQRDVQGQIHTIYARGKDQGDRVEVLLGLDGKILSLYTLDGQQVWRHLFANRFLALYIADIDGDGENEILVGSEDKHLYILDMNGKEIWRHLLGHRITSLYALDIDNDGLIEVLVGSQDNQVHVLRIHPIRKLDEKIRSLYRDAGRPLLTALGGPLLPQRILLQDLVTDSRPNTKSAALEQVESLMGSNKPDQALVSALTLEQQKVQQLWQRGQIGFINTLCLGDISNDPKLKIIIGTNKGRIHAFSTSGQELWSLPLGKHMLTVQTGYLEAGRWMEIIAGSSDSRIYVISGVKKEGTTKRIAVGGNVKQEWQLDEQVSSLYVNAASKRGPFDIIVGMKDKKIHVYRRDFAQPLRIIEPPQGIRVVSACVSHESDAPMIVAGSEGDTNHTVYAYTRDGNDPLWEYKTKGRVEALCIKDIDVDDKLEIIVGSQDRNVHVLDQNGHLKWRYYLPDAVTTVDVCDVDKDSKIEVLAGCNDGQLYVFSREGDLLWSYQAYGSILAIRAEDIDNDKNVEIVIGSEEQLEVVRVVNRKRLFDLVNECWSTLQRQEPGDGDVLLQNFLNHQSSSLRAFALSKIAEQKTLSQQDFRIFESFVKDGSVEVRKALIQAVTANYKMNPQQAQNIFTQLAKDAELEVRLTLVKNIGLLMRNLKKNDCDSYWDDGFKFLQRFAKNHDRVVRRAVMRELYTLVDDFYGKPGRKRLIFGLLLIGLQEPESAIVKASEWVSQEAARTLARFLDIHHNELIMYIYLLIAKEVKPDIVQRIAYHAENTFIKNIFQNLSMLLFGLNETNVVNRLEMAVNTLEQAKSLKYGEETLLIYKELSYLVGLHTIEDIAPYQCTLKHGAFTSTNTHFPAAVSVFKQLNYITRALRLYLRRDGIKDRVNSLLEANNAIEQVRKFAEHEYTKTALTEPLAKLPDRYVLVKILLKRWQILINNEFMKLNGEAKLAPEIQTKRTFLEEQVVVWLSLRNAGDSTADNVYIELLNSNQFEVIGKNTFQTEAIFAQDEVIAEFTIKPYTASPNLVFEIVYIDTDRTEKSTLFDSQLELYTRTEQQTFTTIPNRYSTGVPRTDMCYGREENLLFLKNNLTRGTAGTFIILHGERRSGKTTLLFQLVDTPVLDPHICLRIDMQNESYKMSESRFFYNIAFYITQALLKKGIHIQLNREEDFEKHPTFTLNRFLDIVEDNLGERKLIILIDEFEVLESQVEKKVLAPELFEYLRSIVQDRQNITFLLAGVHTIRQLTAGYWSPFFNIANHYRLSKLSSQGAINLITEPVKGFLEYDTYAVKKIRQLAADQPYLIHLICRPLVDYCNEHKKSYVTINDVNAILHEIMENDGQNHFQWLWKQSSQEERYLLAIVAELGGDEGRLLSFTEMEVQYKHYSIPYQRESVVAALKELVEREVIEKVENRVNEGSSSYVQYRLPVGLIREWLRKNKSVKQVQHEEDFRVQ